LVQQFLRAVPFVSQLAPAANRARPTQASRTRNTPHSVSADQSKDRKSILVTIQIFYSSFFIFSAS